MSKSSRAIQSLINRAEAAEARVAELEAALTAMKAERDEINSSAFVEIWKLRDENKELKRQIFDMQGAINAAARALQSVVGGAK